MSEGKGKIAVTGASGFIGRHVVSEALKSGYDVIGIDRGGPDYSHIESVKCDIRDADRIRKALDGASYVIHLAAITSNVEFERDMRESYDINVMGFLNVLDAAVDSGCKKIVYASSAAVYLKESGFSEESDIDIKRQGNHYAKTKLMNEMTAGSYRDTGKIAATGLRFFNVYGEGENEKGNYASIISQFLKSSRKREKLVVYGDGTQRRDFISVADAARITIMALEKGSHAVYNVGTGSAISYEEIADIIDAAAKAHMPNPLSSYQHLTIADTRRLHALIGDYRLTEVREGIKAIMRKY